MSCKQRPLATRRTEAGVKTKPGARKGKGQNDGADEMGRKVAEGNFNDGSAAVVSEGLRMRRS